MQGPEEKKRIGRHTAPEQDKTQDVIRADTDLYGDEADIPVRLRKKKKSIQPKAKEVKTTKKKESKTPHFKLFARLSDAEAAYSHKARALFEIIRTDESNPHFKTVLIYGRRIPFWPMIIMLSMLALIVLVFINNSNLKVEEETVTVVGLAPDLEDYKMLVISDLNGRRFGDEQSSLLRTINNLDYDSIFFLGDMVGESGDPEPFYELLDGIPSSKEMYFICGDADPGPFVDVPRDITGTLSQLVLEDWILGAIERGAVFVDSPTSLPVGSSTIWLSPSTLMNLEANELVSTRKEQMEQEEDGVISGLEADYITLPATTYRYRVAQNFYNIVDSMQESDFNMILSHEIPSDKSILAASEHESSDGKYLPAADLILAGHYCGGVWQLPLIGAFYVPDNMMARNGWFPAQEDVQGLSASGESQLFISGGLSTNSAVKFMPFRILNQPEITVLTLTATLPENMLSAQ